MAPKNKFTKTEMVEAALRVVRAKGAGGLTAKNIGDELGTSTQPIFTAFGSMDGIKTAVYAAAVDVYDRYTHAGLQEDIPFLGVGKQYIRFAREEPELYRLLFLTREKEYSAAASMRHLQEHVRPALMDIYHITGEEADVYFRDLWLVVHSLSTLIVTDDCPYSDQEVGQDPDGLQYQHLQGHQGGARLCRRYLRPRCGLPRAGGRGRINAMPDAQTQCRP